MISFIGKRLSEAVLTLFLASVVAFLLVRLFPGDPASIYAGQDATEETIAAIRESFGLDSPLPVQYLSWLANAVRGDLGRSYYDGHPTVQLIVAALPSTFVLAGTALAIALLLGITSGMIAAILRGGRVEAAINIVSSVALGIPPFWLGILLILAFVLTWPIFALGGESAADPVTAIRSTVLPAVALGFGFGAMISRFTHDAMLEAIDSEYVRTAQAKGLSAQSVYFQHALRTAVIPLVTIVGLQVASLLGGAVLVEWVFGRPGIGSLAVRSLANRDYAVLQGVLVYLVAIYVVVNLAADLVYGFLDPRVREGRR